VVTGVGVADEGAVVGGNEAGVMAKSPRTKGVSTLSVTISVSPDSLMGIATLLKEIVPIPVLLSKTYVAGTSPLALRKITVPLFWKINPRWSVASFHGPKIVFAAVPAAVLGIELVMAVGAGVEAGSAAQPVNTTVNSTIETIRAIHFWICFTAIFLLFILKPDLG